MDKKHLIDTSIPWIPDGWTLESNQDIGKIDISEISLYLSDKQKNGVIGGEDLLAELKDKQPLNSTVLKFLLDNPKYIPKDWMGKNVYFWGTILRSPNGGRSVLYLYRNGSEWNWNCSWLDYGWRAGSPSAVRASKIEKSVKNNKFMFAIVSEDEAGETIRLFNEKEQAEEFYKKL